MSELNLEVLQFIYQKAQEHGAAVEWGQQMAKMGTYQHVYGNVPFPLWLSTVQSRMPADMLLPHAPEPAAPAQQQIVTAPAQQIVTVPAQPVGIVHPIDLRTPEEEKYQQYPEYDTALRHTHPGNPTPNTRTSPEQSAVPVPVDLDQHAWRIVLFRLSFLSVVTILVFFLIRWGVFNKVSAAIGRIGTTHTIPAQSATPTPSPTQSATPTPSPVQSATPSPSPAQSATPSPSPDSILNGQPPANAPNPHAPTGQPSSSGSEGTQANPSPGLVDRLEQVQPLLEGAVAK